MCDKGHILYISSLIFELLDVMARKELKKVEKRRVYTEVGEADRV